MKIDFTRYKLKHSKLSRSRAPSEWTQYGSCGRFAYRVGSAVEPHNLLLLIAVSVSWGRKQNQYTVYSNVMLLWTALCFRIATLWQLAGP